ncbi:MAG: signal peptide peptidase SppA [Planctomycetota bacterium]
MLSIRAAALALPLFLLAAAPAPPDAPAKGAPPLKAAPAEKPAVSWAMIRIGGSYPEHLALEDASGLFGSGDETFFSLLRRLKRAEQDAALAGVVLDLTGPVDLDLGQVSEIQARVRGIRKAGKRVAALLSLAETKHFLLAAECDEVLMDPAGAMMLTGGRLEVLYVKPLLDKLGLAFDGVQRGKYKNALEPLTCAEMTPASKEVYEAILDRLHAEIVRAGVEGRKIPDARFREILEQGPFSARESQRRGLVDALVADSDLAARLGAAKGAGPAPIIRGYGKRRPKGPASLMDLLSLFKPPAAAAPEGDRISIVFLEGMISEGESGDPFSGGAILRGPTVRILKRLQSDASVKAVVLRVNSPGGSAAASDAIAREVKALAAKKPVIASFGGMAASGGYYFAAPARRILADPMTLTGSIGVFGGKLVMKDLFEKVGIRPQVLARGKRSGIFSPTSPFSEDERKALEAMMEDTYQDFLKVVAEGRKMKVEDADRVGQGRVWTGADASARGLVDELGGLWESIQVAKKEAGIPEDRKMPIEILPKPKTLFEAIFEAPDASGQTRAPANGLGAVLGAIDPALPRLESTVRFLRSSPCRPLALWPVSLQGR